MSTILRGALAAVASAALLFTASVATPADAHRLDPRPIGTSVDQPTPPGATKKSERRGERKQRRLAKTSTATTPTTTRMLRTSAVSTQRTLSWGPQTGSSTLVLYDTGSAYGWMGELYAQGAGNLATHFGRVTAMPVADYAPGQMANFNAVIYLGSTYDEQLPDAFIADVNTGTTKVMWIGYNIWQLAGADGSPGDAAFMDKYGWDVTSSFLTASPVASVSYHGATLGRDLRNGGLLAPQITDSTKVTTVASAQCVDQCDAISGAVDGQFPWAVTSANLTYIGEIPMAYMGENDRYLAFADMLFALHGRSASGAKRAAVRLEDISPNSDPADIREKADYLASAGVPFSMAVIPVYVDPRGVYNNGVPERVTLRQRPEVVAALKYAISKGGTIIQHGTTHQYGTLDNPYNGVTGDDFEFFRARCTLTQNGTDFVDCTDTSWVTYLGSVPTDSLAGNKLVISSGRQQFQRAGLPMPTTFEFPHYAGSDSAYRAVNSFYGRRYERVLNYSGKLLPANAGSGRFMGQFFPYSVTTVYGDVVIPENMGNYEPDAINNHQPRLVPDLLATGKRNLAMTDPVASMFFHPYLPVSELRAAVEGLQGQGYTFVRGMALIDPVK